MSNFIPNETIKIRLRDPPPPPPPPWINKTIKTRLNKQNRICTTYKKRGYNDVNKISLDTFREQCKQTIEKAKANYLTDWP